MNIAVFSTKRSTHHAFLESVLGESDFYYENNLKERSGELVASSCLGQVENAHALHVVSFEMNYSIEKILDKRVLNEKVSGGADFRNIVYLRDPLNTLASTLSVHYNLVGTVKERNVSRVYQNIDLWVDLYDFVRSYPS